MKISVFGLGYVGCVSIGCLSKMGHKIIGVDVSETKVKLINTGKPTIVEKSISQLIKSGYESKKISATTDYKKAVKESDVSFICVGTPNSVSGHLNMGFIKSVSKEIAEGLIGKQKFHTIVIRSTVLPGTNKEVSHIIEKISSKKNLVDFCVVSNPEFLREGNAVDDYFNPSITVVASDSEKGLKEIRKVYKKIKAPVVQVSVGLAEMLKFVNNTFHALKISFANEIGNVCKKLGVDSVELMTLFALDDKLNISKAYLRPGFAYGGSCLPKDLKALNTIAHDHYLEIPIIGNIERSNYLQKKYLFDELINSGKKKIGVLGISFKEGTDDLRQSPILDVVERLIGKGYTVNVYDENVNMSNIIGANKDFIMNKLPHISNLLYLDIKKFITDSEIIIINANNPKLVKLLKASKSDKIIYDLVYSNELKKFKNYRGINW
jgi:GDP-mannose 6-dehydrogenase